MPEEEYPTYDVITEEDKNRFLLQKGYPFFALAVMGIVTALYNLYVGRMLFVYLFLVFAAAAVIAGFIPRFFWKEDQRRDYITSKLYRMNLEYQKKNGVSYTPEELDRMRFENDPLFRKDVIAKVHREEDARYKKTVNDAKNTLARLQKDYDRRYKQIADARWEKEYGHILVNRTEGRLIINGAECDFCSLRSARVVNHLGYRTETYEHHYTEEHTKENRDLSVGGAIAGGIVAGPIGAVAGAFIFSKNNTEVIQEKKTDFRHRDIPVCNHLGIKVNLDGFETEIVLISSPTDQNSRLYQNRLYEANQIAAFLHSLASSPMPKNVLLVEQEPEMMLKYEEIHKAKKLLKKAENNKPAYQIPERYLPSVDPTEYEEEEVVDLTEEDFITFRSAERQEERASR